MALGLGGAGDLALGGAAVKPGPAWAAFLALPLALSGCKAIPDLAGLASGGTVGAATANPALGFLAGVSTSAAVDELVKYIGRSRQNGEQDAIAAVAGELPEGGTAPWRIAHTIPIGNEHGELQVARVIASKLATCKEIVFSVIDGDGPRAPRRLYTADLCRRADRWKWADAEPAVPRWGFLQ